LQPLPPTYDLRQVGTWDESKARMELGLDWLILAAQIVGLGGVCLVEVARPRYRNLYTILVCTTMLILVQGQAWWFFTEFDRTRTSEILHLYQVVTIDGARKANLLAGLATATFLIAYAMFRSRQQKTGGPNVARRVADSIRPSSYGLVAVWTAGASALLVGAAGGILTAATRPGQAIVGGIAMYLIIASIGKLFLLYKLAARQRINPYDIAFFVFVFFLVLINSRFLASFLVVELAIFYNYCVNEIPRKSFVLIGLFFVAIFIGFGLYRDYSSKNVDLSFEDFVYFLQSRSGDENVTSWFYSANVEGFAGLAGIVGYESAYGALPRDLGVSDLRVFLQFVPYGIRNDPALPVADLYAQLASFYPYTGSVVASGLENAYAHWGTIGILLFGIVLAWLCLKCDELMRDAAADRFSIGVVSVHLLQLVRGSFFLALFFAFSECILLLLFKFLIRLTFVGSLSQRASTRGALVEPAGSSLPKAPHEGASEFH
jgi:oligosaccharide repeat unit polymerase